MISPQSTLPQTRGLSQVVHISAACCSLTLPCRDIYTPLGMAASIDIGSEEALWLLGQIKHEIGKN